MARPSNRKLVYQASKSIVIFLLLTLLNACSDDQSASYLNAQSSSANVSEPASSDSANTQDDSSSDQTSSEEPPTKPSAAATCLATDFKPPASIALEQLALTDAYPLITDVSFFPGSSQQFYLLQQTGQIYYISKTPGGFESTLLVDLTEFYDVYFSPEGADSCHECGLYSLAFHPQFETNGFIYASFTEGGVTDDSMSSHIVRFHTSEGGASLVYGDDMKPLRDEIYTLDQTTRIHNNGHIEFGPDGFLYAGFGDGGPGGGGAGKPQQIDNVFGSIVRLTDDGSPAPGNLIEGGLPELYAIGLRNPWRWSFDRLTGDLWLGDVGQNNAEEINIIQNGANYGWPCFEGSAPYSECENTEQMVPPVSEYPRSEGQSVTGGFVYRGTALPELTGQYIYGDFASGAIWALSKNNLDEFARTQLIQSGANISAFAQDSEGELYITNYADGAVYKLTPPTIDDARLPIPETLSESGCFTETDTRKPMPYLHAYDVNEPLWSDGANKERFFRLPDGEKIQIDEQGDLIFPIGTVLIKNFLLQEDIIETRLYLNQPDTGWSGYSYRWDGDEAFLEINGADITVGEQTWHYPSNNECNQCHTAAAGYSLGLEVQQLNREIINPQTGEQVNQLEFLEGLQVFAEPLSEQALEQKLPSSKDASLSIEERVRSYLHSNCSHCHRPNGTTQANMDLRYSTDSSLTNLCDRTPLQYHFELENAKLLDPGDPDNSVILKRLTVQDENRMPPLATNIKDENSIELIHQWISEQEYCATIVGPPNSKYQIVNLQNNAQLILLDGELTFADVDSNTDGWKVIPADPGFFYIQKADDENTLLNVENLTLEAGDISPTWHSAQWIIEKSNDSFKIKNRWKPTWYLQAMPETEEPSAEENIEGNDSDVWQFIEIEN